MLDGGDLEVFTSTGVERTFDAGSIGTSYLWAADEVDDAGAFNPPQVDVEWSCAAPPPPDGFAHIRPAQAYRLDLSQLVGTWQQRIALRPDFDHELLWVESVGYARMFTGTPLTEWTENRWTFAYDVGGVRFEGWVRKSGNPLGSTLDLWIAEAEFGAWEMSDTARNGLPALP